MGALDLCVIPQAETPFTLPVLGIRVWTVEELLYLLCENICLVNEEILNEDLCDWIYSELKQKRIASKMHQALENEEEPQEILLMLLRETGYLNSAKFKETREWVRSFRGLREEERRKLQADTLLENGLCAQAKRSYQRILEKRERSSLKNEFFSRVLNNLAMSCILGQEEEEAAEYLLEACREEPGPDLVKRTAILLSQLHGSARAEREMEEIPGAKEALRAAEEQKKDESFREETGPVNWEEREKEVQDLIFRYRRFHS